MISRVLLFGASGDLAGRFLLPAMAELHANDRLPEDFGVLGAATKDWDDDAFRRFASERLQAHGVGAAASPRDTFLNALRYRKADLGDPEIVAETVRSVASGPEPEPLVAYLALPQGVFATAVRNLGSAELPHGSRVVLENPFGEDLASAAQLNALINNVFGAAADRAAFRVDHVLGMGTVQNLIALRLANRSLEAIWNGSHVEEVQILWEETLALEDRAGYYDHAGALKDVMQNHMMQVLSLVAMEPPASLGERDLCDAKLRALRAVRSLRANELARRTRRARYTAGRLSGTGGAGGRVVPAYAREEGVDPARGTETFAEVLLEIDTPRWAGTRFRLRAGKALARRRKGVILRFRPVHAAVFAGASTAPEELRIGLDGPEDTVLQLAGAAAAPRPELAPFALGSEPYTAELPAYARVLLDILEGGSTLAVAASEAEQAWRIVAPVLNGWADGAVPMGRYPAGSDGPPPLDT
ncbi:MAG: glucose-6-phosphate dehydrogenase [Solirubrobacteraceae bacterium]